MNVKKYNYVDKLNNKITVIFYFKKKNYLNAYAIFLKKITI